MVGDQYINHIYKLVDLIKNSKIKFKYVYGIPRGGLIHATIISHELNLTLVPLEDISGDGLCGREFRNYLSEKYPGLKWYQEPYLWIYDVSKCKRKLFQSELDLKYEILKDICIYYEAQKNN